MNFYLKITIVIVDTLLDTKLCQRFIFEF